MNGTAEMGELPESLGAAIRQARGNRSQREVAESAFLSKSYLGQIETGRRLPPVDSVRYLAGVLGVPAEPLLWLWVREKVGPQSAGRIAGYLQGAEILAEKPGRGPHGGRE